VSWLKVVDVSNLRLAAEPNTTAAVRETMVLVGGRSFFVRQGPPLQPGFAASPSRLVFAVNQKGESDRKVIIAWSERADAKLGVRSGHPWLIVTPKGTNEGRRRYEISIRPDAKLSPGRYDSEIELSAGANRTVTIPVVVEVQGRSN